MDRNVEKRTGIKVLHVDDEHYFLELTKRYLESENDDFTVDSATSSEEGIALLKSGDYDVVIADYQMPGMEGLRFLQHLRESGNTITFIMLTGEGRKEVAIAALNRGANHYIQKGADTDSMYGTLVHAIRDAVEKKRAVEALRESESKYRTIFETTGTATVILEEDTTLSLVNTKFEELSGYSREEVEGKKSWAEFVVDEDLERMKEYHRLRRIDPNAAPTSYEFRYIDKAGSVKDVFLSISMIPGTGKSIASLLDITERKAVDEELRKSEEEYRSLVESTEDSIYLVDRDCRYLFMNEKHLSRLGMSKEQIIGKTYGAFHSEDETKEFAEVVERVFETGKSVQHEHRSHRDNRYILRTLSPVRDSEEGRVTAAVTVVSKDITGRKQAEERQSQLLKELETVNNDLKDFAYIVSHDLKAPLRAITVLAEWLSTDYKDKLDETGREQLDLLMNRVKRMHNLIDGILQYSRVGRLKEEKERVDLNILVSEVITMIEPPENIDLAVVNELPTIVCKKTRMEQVFQNLLSNAVKYMDKPEGEIRIGCTDEAGYWKFSVADNGPGIAEKFYAKIFQIFQTMKPRDEVESTGIGLTIVKKIVETQGGKIWVESKVGEGSTFFFTIPKKERTSETGGVFHSALCIFQLQGGGMS